MTKTPTTISTDQLAQIKRALPFALSFALIPLVWLTAYAGGWAVILVPLITWYLSSIIDSLLGLNLDNADPDATDEDLFWYRMIPLLWMPAQLITLLAMLWYVPQADHLGGWERFFIFFGIGVMTGTIGINYSHELMHQKSKLERLWADILLAMVLYSHFRSEHLLVHHRYVATPRDPVTAHYNEGFHRFYPRVLRQSWKSAFRAEKAMLARKDRPWTHRKNPFFKYWALQGTFLMLALLLGGWAGLGLFLVQAGTAIWQLELVNYVEHYGLTRKHLGDGKYEHVQPHHSWNAAHRASNWLLINLQRHSDHHYKPDRRFPVLQTYGASAAPQLPYGYPVMTVMAMMPWVWRRVMNPRVRKWREMYYPEITDWTAYNKGTTPYPR